MLIFLIFKLQDKKVVSVTELRGNGVERFAHRLPGCSGNPCGAVGCVPGTAHVLKGESNVHYYKMLGKSQTQPDGGEGCSAIATGIRRRILEGGSSAAAG